MLTRRAKFLTFTDPYITLPMVILTRDDAPFLNGLEDLKGGRVAVIRAYVEHEFLQRDYPTMSLFVADAIEEALTAVANGKADAFVSDLASSTFATERLGLKNLKVAATTPYYRELGFGVRKDWPELVTILNKALAAIPTEDQAAVQKHWLNIRFERQMDWGLVWRIVLGVSGISLVIVGIIGVWNRRLTVEVTQRKKTEEVLRQRERELVREKDRAEAASRAKSVFLADLLEMSSRADTPAIMDLLQQIESEHPAIAEELGL